MNAVTTHLNDSESWPDTLEADWTHYHYLKFLIVVSFWLRTANDKPDWKFTYIEVWGIGSSSKVDVISLSTHNLYCLFGHRYCVFLRISLPVLLDHQFLKWVIVEFGPSEWLFLSCFLDSKFRLVVRGSICKTMLKCWQLRHADLDFLQSEDTMEE